VERPGDADARAAGRRDREARVRRQPDHPVEQAREDLEYDEDQRRRMAEMDARARGEAQPVPPAT
jgi:hypothetical protein